MLLSVGVALGALTLRAGAPRLRRAFTGEAVGAAIVQAVVEGTRWQLAPAYLVMIALVVLALGARAEPDGAARRRLGVVRVAAATLAILVATALPALVPVPRFPAPAGPYPVGTVTFVLEDRAREDAWEPGRPRRLLAQVWYPAEPGAARAQRAPYLPEWRQSGPEIARAFGLPSFFLNHLEHASSHSHEGAGFAPSVGRAPLLIMSHGFRLTRSFSTTTAEALASRGYVVVGIDHTGDAAAVAFPGGGTVVS
ncbi:MAG TPA: hypothetical protein VKB80_00795, partial [Kofleriaceae bacterium]|nr:hypothetical protein [Kofleriaceae bacterium]